MSTCADRLRLAGPARMGELLDEFVAVLARRAALDERQSYRLRLAADEITTNILQHGYRGHDGVVDLAAGCTDEQVWIEIEDDAPPFDPTGYDPAPRLAPPPEQRAEGGYGLLLTRGNTDELRYQHIAGRNRTTLVLRRVPGTEGGQP